ncbi:MAG: hypothetical protein M3250_03790, partial [Thermoproteota archaeon]|nr:hypothetical protein [Thermoproteota archaeon]
MRVNVVHINLNARGGSERLALATIAALKEIDDIDIDLTTFQKPDLEKIERTYGKTGLLALSSIKTINIIRSIESARLKKGYDLSINTHGDLLPFSQKGFSKNSAVTYCHFPLAKYLIDAEDEEYGRLHYGLRCSNILDYKENLAFARNTYFDMMRTSTVFTNSEYSRKAICKTFDIDSTVLSP